jgi:hypothetical protein
MACCALVDEVQFAMYSNDRSVVNSEIDTILSEGARVSSSMNEIIYLSSCASVTVKL